ncbi:DUF6950 family protein [Xanthobacteraceae bacterium A53D]
MARLPDWFERLEAVLDHYSAQPYVTGRSDCLTFVLDAIEAVSGAALYPEMRGFATREEGDEWGRALGFATLGDGMAAALAEAPLMQCGPGDVAVIITPDGEAAMVFVEAELVGMGPAGLWRVPRRMATRAFKVD